MDLRRAYQQEVIEARTAPAGAPNVSGLAAATEDARVAAALTGWTVMDVTHRPMPGGGGFLTLHLGRVADGVGPVRAEAKTAVLGFTELGIWLEDADGRGA